MGKPVIKVWNVALALFAIIGIVGMAIATIVGFGAYGAAGVVFWVCGMIFIMQEAKRREYGIK